MKIVAWGFSSSAMSEAFAREVARLPGRNDLLLQIDPHSRTIDFSSVRVAEFLRTDHGQLESLLRGLEKEPDVAIIFDMWRFLLSERFDEALELVARAAARARRAVLVCPHRVSHVSALPLRDAADTNLETFVARTLALHERFLARDGDVTLLCTPPTVEAYWETLGTRVLVPARRVGISFAPRELRESPTAFSSVNVLAREMCRLVDALSEERRSLEPSQPRVDATVAMEVAWPEGARAFDCTWDRYVAAFKKNGEPGPGTTSALPASVTPDNRASIARLLFAYGAWEKARTVVSSAPPASGGLGLLFPLPHS
jgi:hypothetical protein